MEIVISLAIGVLAGAGVWLILRPRTFQVLIGLSLLSYAVNLFIFAVGSLSLDQEPIVRAGVGATLENYTDPLPQALVLTAIVITLASVSFTLAMAYRSWQLNGHDDVQDDVEDDTIRRLASIDVTSEAYAATTSDFPGDDSSGDPGQGPDDDPQTADAAGTRSST